MIAIGNYSYQDLAEGTTLNNKKITAKVILFSRFTDTSISYIFGAVLSPQSDGDGDWLPMKWNAETGLPYDGGVALIPTPNN